MSDSFVPLVSAAKKPRDAAFAALPANGMAPGAAPSASNAPGTPGNGSETCSKPVVTLQRTGEMVSGIRIQCGCGQVIELACAY